MTTWCVSCDYGGSCVCLVFLVIIENGVLSLAIVVDVIGEILVVRVMIAIIVTNVMCLVIMFCVAGVFLICLPILTRVVVVVGYSDVSDSAASSDYSELSDYAGWCLYSKWCNSY